MKHSFNQVLSALVLAGAGMLVAAPAAAQGTFTPGSGTAQNCNPASSPIAQFSCTNGSVTATMTSWGYFGSAFDTGVTTAQSGWVQGTMGDFDGSGIGAYTGRYETSGGSPSGQHGFDNITTGCGTSTVSGNAGLDQRNSGCGGSVEALLLNFGNSKVNLTQIGVGWISGDADISVYRWDGAASGPNMTTQTVQNSTSGAGSMAGWTLVGSPTDFNSSPSTSPVGGNQFSSYFLVTTYFGATYTSGNTFDMGNDRFKFNTFTANLCVGTLTGGNGGNGGNGATCGTNQTPEPTSLALVGLALAGAGVLRRRQQRAARG